MIASTEQKAGIGASIRIEGLSKSYDNVRAVDDISLDIASGEFLTLLGGSGSGKTTTLMAVAGFVTTSAGRICIDDRDISGLPPEKRGLGVVFQSYALFPHYDVFDNVAFPLNLRRMPKSEIRAKVKRALELVDLGAFAKRRISELSGGQQQRVALARAIVFSPPVLLMDEPLGALDRKLREQLQGEIKRIQVDLGATVLYVTHDQEEALSMSDRLAIMRDGRIDQIGRPDDVYAEPNSPFVARFLGESNFVPIRLVRNEGHQAVVKTEGAQPIQFEVHVATLEVLQRDIVGMVRPEAIRLGGTEAVQLPVVVEHYEYLGPTVRINLAAGFGTLTARVSRLDWSREYSIGTRLCVGWGKDDMVLFARKELEDATGW